MTAYYNENDKYCAAWLRNLIRDGHIAHGDVDERSIVDVSADDVRGYDQCHWFAGIGGWSLALRLAGFPDDRPVWTGSCPCQPFSAAGQGKAADDERHLWPHWFRLIRAVRPPTVFFEQVEAAIGWGWLDTVHADLEPEGYAVRSAVLPACCVGAPHIRARLWGVADASNSRRKSIEGVAGISGQETTGIAISKSGINGHAGLLADADWRGCGEQRQAREGDWRQVANGHDADRRGEGELADAMHPGRPEGRPITGDGQTASGGASGELGDADIARPQGRLGGRNGASQRIAGPAGMGHWSDCVWLPCSDGKARPAQPGIFPLAARLPNRVAQLRAAGNSIVPQVAAAFIKAAR